MIDRKIWFGLIGGGLLLAAGMVGLIYMEAGEIEQAKAEVGNLRKNIDSSRQLIEGTSELESQVIVLREMADVFRTILPDEKDLNNFVRTIEEFGGAAGAQFFSFSQKPDASRGRSASDFDKIGYTWTVEGDVFQFLSLLDKIETHKRFISVPSFKITGASRQQIERQGIPRHQIQFDVETYKYQPRGNLEPVRIEGYARKRDLLTGEINRRRQGLSLSKFQYRGPRARRDPFVDPRVPALPDKSQLSVQQQMDLVEELVARVAEAQGKWSEVQGAENILQARMLRSELGDMLALIDEDLRRIDADGQVSFVPAQRRLSAEVHDPMQRLRDGLAQGTSVLGPSREALEQVLGAMRRHLDRGEYVLALDLYADTVEDDLDLLKGDPVREALAATIRQVARDAQTLRDFSVIPIEVRGIAIMEGTSRAIIINGRSFTIGDMVDHELEIYDIRSGEIDFIFRGAILTRAF